MYDLKCDAPNCDVTLGTGSKPITGMVCENHVPSYTPEPPLEERIAELEASLAGLSAMMMETPVE
jgi:hypothetical protein